MTNVKPKIGILTSGGDCPGLNAVIRGVVRSANLLGYDTLGFRRGYEGLVDPVTYMSLTLDNTSGILSTGGTILGSTNKGRFAATRGVDKRIKLDSELLAQVRQTVEQLGLEGLIAVGGDGSLTIAQQMHEAGIPIVGVPKTIDNDLSATAFTFGFNSALACATDALDRLHTTAASHDRIFILEVMGRHAGWIALHAGIAGGANVILIPEIAWTFENVCRKIMKREQRGRRFTLIVVAEGAQLPDSTLVSEADPQGGQDHLGGIGDRVAREIEKRLCRETRTCVLGHLQRGGGPTAFDRVLATELGVHAVRLISSGEFGRMVCYQPPDIHSVPLRDAVLRLSRVNPAGSAVQTARGLGISFGDASSENSPFTGLSCSDPLQVVEQLQTVLESEATAR